MSTGSGIGTGLAAMAFWSFIALMFLTGNCDNCLVSSDKDYVQQWTDKN